MNYDVSTIKDEVSFQCPLHHPPRYFGCEECYRIQNEGLDCRVHEFQAC